MKLTKQEQKIEYLRHRLSTARTKEILLLNQIITLKRRLTMFEHEPAEHEADPIDHSANMQAKIEAEAIARIRDRAQEPIPPAEHCYYCGEETAGARWCDAHCRDGWEQEKKMGAS